MFAGKAWSISIGRLLALPTNIKLGWKRIEVANTLAYYHTATTKAVKKIYCTGDNDIKLFMAVIHECL
jgi:hypothetical protein